MINADERKKLLEQITELEKNSVNYFDVEKEFFLIDSDNLSQVRSKLYGYSIQATGIYEDDNLTPEAVEGLDGRGCYVYVGVKDGKITIKQDLNGCWGIYLFRRGDYFALSNSFFRLLDHVKFKYPLTVNRDYCHDLLTIFLNSYAYSETAVNEIQDVDRNAILQIDISEKNLQIEFIDYKENTVTVNSEEGVATLDRWLEFWSDLLSNLSQHTKFIKADLSGGFDSRVSLIPLLYSGIDLGKVRIHSIKGTLHTYKEDYEIASKIAEHYGFKLNPSFPEQKFLNYSLSDIWNIDLYHRQTFSKSSYMIYSPKKSIEKSYYLMGYSGEGLRGSWLPRFESLEKFKLYSIGRANLYPSPIREELSRSVETILESAFQTVRNKYKIEDQNSPYIVHGFYYETQSRSHFGKFSLGYYFQNNLSLSPALDPEIRKLQFNTPECLDYKLLIALIFTRYAPDLLKFPFNSKRFIAPETIEYAKKINERFQRRVTINKNNGGGGISFTAA